MPHACMGIHWGTGVGQLSMVEGSKHSFTPVRWAWSRPHGRPFFASAAVNSSAARPMADAPDAPPSQRPFSRLEKTRRGRPNFRDVIARCRRTRTTPSLFAFQADFKIRLVHAHAPVTDRGGKESPTISYYRKGHCSDCRVF